MDCQYDDSDVCQACGQPTRNRDSKRRCPAGDGLTVRLPPIAIGSAVEQMLTAVGITKERVAAWLRVKDCGCEARKNWLNLWGENKRRQVERLLTKAAKWYGMI